MNKSEPPASNGSPEADEQLTDEALVLRVQSGDSAAYDELVTRHRGRIFSMIRQMVKNEADAWDLSQEVFIKAWKALPRFEVKAKFSTWLYRIAHNSVYDWARRKRPEAGDELNEEIFRSGSIDPASRTTPGAADRPDESQHRDELRIKIEAALNELSPAHREVVLLKDVQGLAYKEIAEVMECSIGTVMSRLHYARQKLQTLLKDEYEAE
jgi:RNA polymerase sigma-70 factor (ECF subfamily)